MLLFPLKTLWPNAPKKCMIIKNNNGLIFTRISVNWKNLGPAVLVSFLKTNQRTDTGMFCHVSLDSNIIYINIGLLFSRIFFRFLFMYLKANHCYLEWNGCAEKIVQFSDTQRICWLNYNLGFIKKKQQQQQ